MRGACGVANIIAKAIRPERWELDTEQRQPVTDRSAWRGVQLDADPRWRHVLSEAEGAELVQAARAMAPAGRTQSRS